MMLEYIENYDSRFTDADMKCTVWLGEMVDFDRGVIYLTIGTNVYKIDFHQPPNYCKMYSAKLRLLADNQNYPYVINLIHNSQLISQLKSKSAEADHLSLYHFVIATNQKVIELLVENIPHISLVSDDKKETTWKL